MKLLVLRDEGLGNFLQSTPALQSIKKNIPNSNITVWIDPRAYPLAIGHPYIDKLVKWPDKPKGRFDACLVFVFNSGTYVQEAKKISDRMIFHPKIDYLNKSETYHNFEIAKQIGGWKGEMYPNSIYISPEDLKYGEERTKDLKRPVIGLSIGNETMVKIHKKRFWRNDKWLKTINLLHEKYKPTIIFFGAKAEEKESKALLKNIPSKINLINLFGKTTIKQVAATIKNCDLFISLDCGLMHIASAVRTNLVALFGPTDEIKSQIWTDEKKYKIVRHSISCAPCYVRNPGLFQSCSRQLCMEGIQPEMIISAIEEKGFLKNYEN